MFWVLAPNHQIPEDIVKNPLSSPGQGGPNGVPQKFGLKGFM